MTWVPLDDKFPTHPKVIAVGGDAAWLYVCGLCWTNSNLTGGRIPKSLVPRLCDRRQPMKLARALCDAALWHDRGDHFEVHDWERWNQPATEAKARRDHAQAAAMKRWYDSHGNRKPTSAVSTDRASTELPEDLAIAGAVGLVAQRRHALRSEPIPSGKRRDAWLVKAAANAYMEHADDLASWAAEGLDPTEMADRLEPVRTTSPRPYVVPDLPDPPKDDTVKAAIGAGRAAVRRMP